MSVQRITGIIKMTDFTTPQVKEWYEKYYAEHGCRNWHTMRRFNIWFKYLPRREAPMMLDVGCGAGMAGKWARRHDVAYIGIDIAVNAVGKKNPPGFTIIERHFLNFCLKIFPWANSKFLPSVHNAKGAAVVGAPKGYLKDKRIGLTGRTIQRHVIVHDDTSLPG